MKGYWKDPGSKGIAKCLVGGQDFAFFFKGLRKTERTAAISPGIQDRIILHKTIIKWSTCILLPKSRNFPAPPLCVYTYIHMHVHKKYTSGRGGATWEIPGFKGVTKGLFRGPNYKFIPDGRTVMWSKQMEWMFVIVRQKKSLHWSTESKLFRRKTTQNCILLRWPGINSWNPRKSKSDDTPKTFSRSDSLRLQPVPIQGLLSIAHNTLSTKRGRKNLHWKSSSSQKTGTSISIGWKNWQRATSGSATRWPWPLRSLLDCFCCKLMNKATQLPKISQNYWLTEIFIFIFFL